jgi:hypothetical protein
MAGLLSELNGAKTVHDQPGADEIYKEDFYPVEELPEEEKPSPTSKVRNDTHKNYIKTEENEDEQPEETPKFSNAESFTDKVKKRSKDPGIGVNDEDYFSALNTFDKRLNSLGSDTKKAEVPAHTPKKIKFLKGEPQQ